VRQKRKKVFLAFFQNLCYALKVCFWEILKHAAIRREVFGMEKMKLGLIDKVSEEGFRDVASFGLRYIEFCIDVGKAAQPFLDQADQINGWRKQYGVDVCSIGRWGVARLRDDGSVIEEELQNDLKLIELAKRVECPVFVCGVNRPKEMDFPTALETAVAYLTKIVEAAEAAGVQATVYNCDWNNFICDAQSWPYVFMKLPALGLKYDISHCINRNGDYLQELMLYGNRVKHFHLKGTGRINGKNIPDPPAGLDDAKWGLVMALLYTAKYTGVLSIEPHSGIWQRDLREFGIRFAINHFTPYITN
jgi:sugar phosphate isomerase/epimerase